LLGAFPTRKPTTIYRKNRSIWLPHVPLEYMCFLVLLLLTSAAAQVPLQDGVPDSDTIESIDGGEVLYSFEITERVQREQDLSVTVTTFSDLSDPDLYLSYGQRPSKEEHTWQSISWGSGVILLPAAAVRPGTYYALVTCNGPCAYDIAFSHVNETQLRLGVPQVGTLARDKSAVLTFTFLENAVLPASLTFAVAPYDPSALLQIAVRKDELPTIEESLPVLSVWPVGFRCVVTDISPGATYRVLILALSDFTYEVTVLKPGQELALQPSVPVRGTAGPASFTYYKLSVGQFARFVKVQLTAFAGQPSVYLKYDTLPTKEQYDYTSTWFNDTVFIRPGEVREGELFIGVFSETEAAYTIYVTTNPGSWVPLYPGLPQAGVVRSMHPAYAFLDMSNGLSRNITFRLSPVNGNPNLYVQLCHAADYRSCAFVDDVFNHPENYNVHSSRHREGDDYVMIPHNGYSCVTSACRYVIAVISQDSGMGAKYLLSATFDESNHYRLMHDVPVRMTLQRQGYLYFQYTAFSAEADSLTFQLTPTSGDPDLYISRSNTTPTTSDFEKASTNVGVFMDSVTYRRGEDGIALNGTYHVAVYSWAQTTFSLVVHESVPDRNSTIRLYQGQPQQGIVYQNRPNRADSDYRIYMFETNFPEGQWPAITVSLTTLTGILHMYVANSPEALDWLQETFLYEWCTCYVNNSGLANSITILPDDPSYRANSVYLVLVQGQTFGADGSASFIVSYSLDGSSVYLQEGIPYFDEVAMDQYKYYLFPLSQDHEDVTIQVTALAGDPDLYVLLNSSVTKPGKDQFDYNSTMWGSADLVVMWEQLKFHCPAPAVDAGFGQMHSCLIYLAVYGFTSATYSIRVSSRRSLPVFLPLGVSSSGFLNSSEYAYYYASVGTVEGIAVHLQSLHGDADLYVNILDHSTSGVLADWKRPNKAESHFQSRSAALGDYISLSPADLQTACSSGACVLLAGAYCFSTACHYTITMTQDKVLPLLEGVPVFGNVDSGEYVYYKFYNQKDTTALLITLTPLSYGDPDLYVDRGANSRPTAVNSTWRSISWRGEELFINSTDPHFEGSSMRGYYVIGVRGFSNCSYSLTVSANPQPVMQLVSGMPVEVDVPAWGVRYFSFYNYLNTEVTFTITPMFGSVVLRVNAYPRNTGELYQNLPQRNHSTWSSTASGHQNRLVVSFNDSSFCSDCTFVIGVFAESDNCSFSLSVSSGEEAVLLQNGIPALGQVAPSAWKYYIFYLYGNSDLDISVVNYSGDADLYVTTEGPVNAQTAQWKKVTTKHVEHLTISKSDPHYIAGQYSIGVYGNRNTSYSITAHARDSYITLVDGWPQSYSIMQTSEDHLKFQFYMGVRETEIASCRLRRQEPDFWPRVFVTYFRYQNMTDVQPPAEPTPVGSEFSYSRRDYDQVYGTLTFNLLTHRDPGEYQIAVYGMAQSDPLRAEETGTFELSCSAQTNATVLLAGRLDYGLLSSTQQKQRYQIYVSEPGLLQVTAVPCTGRLAMTISDNYTTEENSGVDVVVSRVVDGKIQAEIVNAVGPYYITLSLIQSTEDSFGASYQLSYDFYPHGLQRPKKIIPGNEGQIIWQSTAFDTVRLTWKAPEYENGYKTDGVIYYLIYITNHTQVKMNTVCGMRTAEDRGEVWAPNTEYSNDTSALIKVMPGQAHVVNIVSVVFTSAGMVHLPYAPTEVFLRAPRSRRKVGMLLIGGITAVLLVALVGLFVLWRKYKRVKRTLENEMQDVRNVASISSSQLDVDQPAPRQTAIYQPLELAKDT